MPPPEVEDPVGHAAWVSFVDDDVTGPRRVANLSTRTGALGAPDGCESVTTPAGPPEPPQPPSATATIAAASAARTRRPLPLGCTSAILGQAPMQTVGSRHHARP